MKQIIQILAFTSLIACGKPTAESQIQNQPKTPDAKTQTISNPETNNEPNLLTPNPEIGFQPKMVQFDSKEEKLPDANQKVVDQAQLTDRGDWIFGKQIPLYPFGTPHSLLLSFEDQYEGEKIDKAYYTLVRINPLEEKEYRSEPHLAFFNESAKYFYIPIHEMIGQPEHINPIDQYKIEIELRKGSEIKTVHCLFKLVGKLPQPIIKKLESPYLSSNVVDALTQIKSDDGLIIDQFEITNPESRSIYFWPKTLNSKIKLNIGMVDSVWVNAASVRNDGYQSNTELSFSQLLILRNTSRGAQTQKLSLSGSFNQSFILEPNETVILKWVAKPSAARCSLPANRNHHFTWDETVQDCHRSREEGNVCVPKTIPHSADRVSAAHLNGYSIIGETHYSLMATDLGISQDTLNQWDHQFHPQIISVIENEKRTGEFASGGEQNSSAPLFRCQGIF